MYHQNPQSKRTSPVGVEMNLFHQASFPFLVRRQNREVDGRTTVRVGDVFRIYFHDTVNGLCLW